MRKKAILKLSNMSASYRKWWIIPRSEVSQQREGIRSSSRLVVTLWRLARDVFGFWLL